MSELEKAEKETKTDLTTTQKKTGDYQKGKVNLKGVSITIENPKGSIRSGYSPDGKHWKTEMKFTYGYINDSVGYDGDEIDVFLGPLAESSDDFTVFIIKQLEPVSRKLDELKVMFGFSNSSEAKKAYLSCYEEGWDGYGSMQQISLKEFLPWVKKVSNETFINQLKPTNNEVESIKLIKLFGEVLENETLKDLQKQAGDLSRVKTLVISIESPGGDVSEGIEIMKWFDYLSSTGIKVVTIVLSNAYSIASLIMLAADHKLIAKDADVMVHNPMVPELKLVNANELEKHVKDLRNLEFNMYKLYEIFTDLTIEEIKKLMDNETYLSASDSLRYGFADEIVNTEKRPKVMAIKNLKLKNMSKALNTLNQVIAMVSGKKVVNQSYYNDEGSEIEIYQQDPSCYSKGDRTSVESGKIKLQDGSVLEIEDWVIKEIDKATPLTTEVVDPVVVDPVADFNVGPSPVPEAVVEKPVEMKTEVTKTETTKTEPVMVVAEPVAVAEVEPVAVVEPVTEPVVEKQVHKEDYDFVPIAQYQALEKRLMQLEGEFKSFVGKFEVQNKESNSFQETATEAIKMIAGATSSNFRPAAKSTVESEPTGSIFQQAKARVEAAKRAK